MRYDDSVKRYSIDRRSPQKNEHLGNVTYTNKFTNSKKRKKKLQRRRALVAGGVAAYFLVGGIYMGTKIVDKTKDLIVEQITEMQEANEAYREAQKPVIFTNYTNDEIRAMDIDARINLYQEYLDYINAHADIPYAYQRNGIPDNLNFWRIYSDANYSYIEYKKYGAAYDEEVQKKTILSILDRYQQAMDIVTEMYNGKYSLNSPEVNDDVNLIHNVKVEKLDMTP